MNHHRRNSLSQRPLSLGVLLLLGALFFTLSSLRAMAGETASSAKSMTADELFKRYKGAVAKVTVRHHGVPIAEGAGFFVSSEGDFVTSRHLLRSTMLSAAFDAEIFTADGVLAKSFRIAGCGDKRQIDLCLIRLDMKPVSFFQVSDRKPTPGEAAFVIGHPRGLDFSISNGIVSGVRASSTGVDEVQISTAISPGTSGGPIFNDRGELLGIVSRYMTGGQSLNFGIATPEIANYLTFNKDFISLSGARQKALAQTEKQMRDLSTLEVEPALSQALKGRSLQGAAGFREFRFDFGAERISAYIPAIFESCSRTQTSPTSVVYACNGWSDSVVFSAQRMPAPSGQSLARMDGKRLIDPKPLNVVASLSQDGLWQDFESKLTLEQRTSFDSKPLSAQCQSLRPSELLGAAFKGGLTACRFSVENTVEPGSRSENVWVEKDGILYAFNIWMRDPTLVHYLKHVPTIAVLSSKTESTPTVTRTLASIAVDRPGANYSITLGPSMEFIAGQKNDESVTDRYEVHGLYAKKDVLRNITVRFLRRAIGPAQYVKVSEELFNERMSEDGIQIKKDSIDPGTMDYNGTPIQLITAFGMMKGKEVMVLSAVLFGPGDTFMITQVTDVGDPSQSFSVFKKAVASFKRK